MKMHRVRLRMLAAMGMPIVAGCGSPQVADPGGGTGEVLVDIQDTPAPHPDGEEPADQVLVADAKACGRDEVKEQVCGGVREPTGCGPSGERLKSFGGPSFQLTHAGMTAHNPAYASYPPDEALTTAYREELRVKHPHITNREAYCCYSRCTAVEVGPPMAMRPIPPHMMAQERCIPEPSSTSEPSPEAQACPASVSLGGAPRPFVSVRGEAQCCYQTLVPRPPMHHPRPMRGRPMRIEGQSVSSNPVADSSWIETLPRIAEPDAAVREALASAWLEEARLEHASVAAFAKLSLQLLALGAPPQLIDAAHVAARDEIAHARHAFGVAARLSGTELGPAPVPTWTAPISNDMVVLLEETLSDGCLGETAAAQEAATAAARATSPELRSSLSAIAEDELRHAELGWQIAAWCVARLGSPGRDAVVALRDALAREVPVLSRPGCCSRPLEADGILCRHEREAVRSAVIGDVVVPCLDALAASGVAAVDAAPVGRAQVVAPALG